MVFDKLIPLGRAIELIKSCSPRIRDVEEVPVREALDRVLAENIVALIDIPPYDRAAMDGYAVFSSDTIGASPENPRILRIVGESDIGRPFGGSVGRGEAVYVHTGSQIPPGADAVVPVEFTDRSGHTLYVYISVSVGDNISQRGEDFRVGEKILMRGERLTPQDISAIKAQGIKHIKVYRRPIVSVMACGDELVDDPEELRPGKILEYSREIVIGLARKYGCEVVDLGICPDDRGAIEENIRKAMEVSDVLITVGGTSIGRRDLIPRAIKNMGQIIFHGISIQPGKPVCAGKIGEKFIVLGAPGLPVATYICGITIMKTLIEHISNVARPIIQPRIRAKLSRKIWSKPGIRTFARVKIHIRDGEYVAEPIRISGSGILSSLIRGDGIVVVSEEMEGIDAGEYVDVILIR